jgi:hypothetical protein
MAKTRGGYEINARFVSLSKRKMPVYRRLYNLSRQVELSPRAEKKLHKLQDWFMERHRPDLAPPIRQPDSEEVMRHRMMSANDLRNALNRVSRLAQAFRKMVG